MIIAAWFLALSQEGLTFADLIRVPVVGLMIGFVVSPVVGVGLVLFGMPLTRLIGDKLTAKSGWLFAIAASIVSGVIFLTMVDALFSQTKIDQVQLLWIVAFSLPYSVPTGLVWWIFIRRDALNQPQPISNVA